MGSVRALQADQGQERAYNIKETINSKERVFRGHRLSDADGVLLYGVTG